MPDTSLNPIIGLLLAAGASRRFGTPKLLTMLDGEALILHSCRALSVCDRIVAVVRAQDIELHDVLRKSGVEMVVNAHAEQGMGHSIACGVDATQASTGWCILPADMPAILPATTNSIVQALRGGAPLVAPVHRGHRGHPVGFGSVFKHDLMMLTGDGGARSILDAHQHQLQSLKVEDAGILLDIDTPDQLRKQGGCRAVVE
jgi:molybdenum cofactor cytidylyltransferase